MAFAYPTWDVSWLVWVALAPALAVLWLLLPYQGTKRLLAAGVCGWGLGSGFFLTSLYWITEVSWIGWPVVALYLGLYPATWAAVAATVGRPDFSLYAPQDASQSREQSWMARLFASSVDSARAAVVNASSWTALEWVRSWMFTGFGWNGLGVALHENHVLIQICDIVGATGLSFFVMLGISVGTSTIYRIVLEIRHARIRPHADFFAVLAVFLALFIYGTFRIEQFSELDQNTDTESIQCLIVQPNVSQDIKWEELYADEIMATLYQQTATGTLPGLDLVVWPETAVPFALQSQPAKDIVDQVLKLGDFTLISGFNDIQSESEFYNALALFHGDYFNVRVYRKTHLVPFGEFIPFRDSFPPFEWIAGGQVTDDYTRGTDFSPIQLVTEADSGAEVIPLICFEDTVGNLVRRFYSANPQLMVTVTNNGWFYESSNSQQHLANAKFRCIEMRRPMIRSANTGVTCHIGPAGDVKHHVHHPESGSTFVEGALFADVRIAPHSNPTFYARHGDLFSKLLGLVSLATLLGRAFKRNK